MKFFTAADFFNSGCMTNQQLADRANQKLQRDAKVVYGKDRQWDIVPDAESAFGCTHKGLLICVEELPEKECKHEIVRSTKITRDIGIVPYRYVCEKCNAELKPTGWEVVE